MSALKLPCSNDFAAACLADGEFMLAARYWNGGLVLQIGDEHIALNVAEGAPAAGDPDGKTGTITLSAPANVWEQILAPVPPRFMNDILPPIAAGLMTRSGDDVVFAQYYPAIMRAVEILRAPNPDAVQAVERPGETPRFDTPVGRYVHLEVEGQDYRIYFEEAGQGIPLLLQHTAGCHGSQWRHLFEVPEITSRFRLIAYDLPFHGKSVPPVGRKWWAQEYRLRGDFLRALVVQLAQALDLRRPVFMGCSVGGLLALDLARRHPDAFRAVISVEGALHVEGDLGDLQELWHPQVSNEYKARMMNALMSPTSPEGYRKETSQIYAAGWPPVFLGDLHYYAVEFDLRDQAAKIDTSRVAVHILSGEYDFSGTVEAGRAAHEAITGSKWTEMKGLGHFPMSEDPQRFLEYLLPVLAEVGHIEA
jgi:pimeloyl-ACP methyl ester carboxylesterase